MKTAMQAAKPMLLRNIVDFDTQEFLLNTPIATYDLRNGTNGAKPHNADDRITKITAVSPSEDNMDLWLSALENTFCGDKELIEYVQQIVGLAALGEFYREYRAYCTRNGEFTGSTTEFYAALEKAGFLRKKTKSGNVIMGLQLKSDFGG